MMFNDKQYQKLCRPDPVHAVFAQKFANKNLARIKKMLELFNFLITYNFN